MSEPVGAGTTPTPAEILDTFLSLGRAKQLGWVRYLRDAADRSFEQSSAEDARLRSELDQARDELDQARDELDQARDELTRLRAGAVTLADTWTTQGRQAEAYINRASASEIHEVAAEASWYPQRAIELLALLAAPGTDTAATGDDDRSLPGPTRPHPSGDPGDRHRSAGEPGPTSTAPGAGLVQPAPDDPGAARQLAGTIRSLYGATFGQPDPHLFVAERLLRTRWCRPYRDLDQPPESTRPGHQPPGRNGDE